MDKRRFWGNYMKAHSWGLHEPYSYQTIITLNETIETFHSGIVRVCTFAYFHHISVLPLYAPLYSTLALCIEPFANSVAQRLRVSGLTSWGQMSRSHQILLDEACIAVLLESAFFFFFFFFDLLMNIQEVVLSPLPNPPFLSSHSSSVAVFHHVHWGREASHTPPLSGSQWEEEKKKKNPGWYFP